jgi:hypothetical protein
VSFCHHLASVVCRLSSVNFSHFNLLREDWNVKVFGWQQLHRWQKKSGRQSHDKKWAKKIILVKYKHHLKLLLNKQLSFSFWDGSKDSDL